jgi:hypothetical protein
MDIKVFGQLGYRPIALDGGKRHLRLEGRCVVPARSEPALFDRHGISFKKSLRPPEQDRPDVAAARTAWAEDQPKLDPERLVFIDETGTSTNMVRLRGRAPRGERLVSKA